MAVVLHLAKRPYNGHPNWLAMLQRRRGDDARTCFLNSRESGARPYPCDIRYNSTELSKFIERIEILHLHGDMTVKSPEIKAILKKVPRSCNIVQQYYHERSRTGAAWDTSVPCAIIRKKAAILEPGLPTLPFVVPHWLDELQPQIRQHARLKVVYAPTDTRPMLRYAGTSGKGYQETVRILKSLDKDRFDISIIHSKNWRESQTVKREADVCVEELVTGGFGQSSLESLANGSIIVANILPEVKNLYQEFFPYIASSTSELKETLERIAEMSWQQRQEMQQAGVEWIRKNHSEASVYADYQRFYQAEKESPKRAVVKSLDPIQIIDGEIVQKPQCYIPEVEESMPAKSLNILQIARTNCAGSIWRIHDAINAHTEHRCRTITFSNRTNGRLFPHDILMSDARAVTEAIMKADVIHFHNWIDHNAKELMPYRHLLTGKQTVLQYHTEPSLLRRAFPGVNIITRTDIKTLVIAQKHVRFYPNSAIVPNMVNPEHPLLTPINRYWMGNEPLRLIFTPSDTKGYADYTNTCCGKGYPEMLPMLKRLEARGIISLRVITDMTWEELMPIKQQHDVCIDECVTGGYHLCSLESLSQGLITLAWLDDQTQDAIHRVVGEKTELPWVNVRINEVEETLTKLRFKSPEEISVMKQAGREWILRNWHPRKLIRHFLDAYGHVTKPIISVFNRSPVRPIYRQPATIDDSLMQLKGAWSGEKVVIWGNGPSAKNYVEHDFGNAHHIGTNGILNIRQHFDAYAICDRRFFHTPEKRRIANEAPGIRIFAAHVRDLVSNRDGASFVGTLGMDGFCSDITKGVFQGLSVVWVAMQVAVWAGAREIMLVGCEHDYSGEKRCYDEGDKPAPVDLANTQRILSNYARLMPILNDAGISLSTIGASALQRAGVPRSL